ncbi:EAL domain-containing protein [Exiguobacterium antarcticum]|uniref:EAL domain-containing protein n=1 Tax=Exiguobacterium antarcticum TaxID=132920 RepID=A0ABT6R0F8_9BACL|nr:EAL domain-containing protein [Exiguobacterium antarcticum]MDI3234421.1 EAL domain-containing protein [Exiguobacterium antarcticum]
MISLKKSYYVPGILLFIMGYYIWIILFEQQPVVSAWGNNVFSIFGCIIATVLLLQAHQKFRQHEGRFFLYLACGTGSYLIAELIWMSYENIRQVEVPFPGVSDIFYVFQSVWFLAAFLHLIRRHVTKNRLISFIFDIAIVMTVAVTYSWFFLIRPLFDTPFVSRGEVILAFAYPMCDIVLLFCMISIYYLFEKREWQQRLRLFQFLFIGLLLQVGADTLFVYMTTVSGNEAVRLIDPLFILGLLMIGVAGHIGSPVAEEPQQERFSSGTMQLGKLFLPYVLVILLFSTMALYARRDEGLTGLMLGCAITILLILIRQILMILSNHELIEEIHHKADELEVSEERYKSLFTYHPDAVYSLDLTGRIESANPSFEKLTEQSANELVGQSYRQLMEQQAATDKTTAHQFETIFRKSGGMDVLLNVTNIPIRVRDRFVGMYGIGQDITTVRENELKIRRLAYYDHLTGAINRTYFEEVLHHLVEGEQDDETIILCFIDLDDFKLVNDSFGHHVGDQLLIQVVQRLTETVDPEDIVARQGGDEFTVILRKVTSDEQGRDRTARLLDCLKKTYSLDGIELISNPSIGAVSCPRTTGKHVVTLLKQADLAMYQAKSSGGKSIVFFEDIAEKASYRLRLESELPIAIETDQLILYYQPQVDTLTYQMVGVEGLVRWNHPELGMIAPNDFIPMAEEAGMIIRLGEWVLREGFLQAKRWEEEGLLLKVGLNVSMQQFHHPTFVLTLIRLVEETKVNPNRIDLEITEVSAVEDIEETVETMNRLKELGFTISIDDFGTGYSSLSRLADFPIDTLKIPREFVEKIQPATTGYSMISSIIHLAKSLELEVIAEGVETLEQVNVLNWLECSRMQGYYFGRPMPAEHIPALYQK